MSSLEIVLGIGVVAAVAGVVWLLWQRGALAARALAAEAARADAEARLATAQAGAQAQEGQLRTLTADAARLHAEREAEKRARQDDASQAEQRLEMAVESERRAHAEEVLRLKQVHEKELASLQEARRQIELKLEDFTQRMTDTFATLSKRALTENSGQLLQLAKEQFAAHKTEAAADLDQKRRAIETLVQPIREKLTETTERLGRMEKDHATQGATLQEQVRGMAQTNESLRQETGRLVQALRDPKVRGRAGEMQLKRVLDVAGLRSYCDFEEQGSTRDAEGNILRPDLIVKLPSGRHLVVDAKANLLPYLDAHEATDPDKREQCMQRFADGIAAQAAELAKKNYWKQYDGSPEIVVMFVPGDQLVDMALSKRPDLLEYAASHGVILASPGSLIGLFRAVQVGFREQKLTEEARAIQALAKELHTRCDTLVEHVNALGKIIESAADRFNKLVGSIDTRLMPTLRKIESAGVSGGEALPEVAQVRVAARQLNGASAAAGDRP